jgi:hypothetical protein
MGQTEYTAAVLTDSPKAFMKLNEGSGLPQDSSGNGNHIASQFGVGTITYSQAGPFSGSSSIFFDSTSNTATFNYSSILSTVVDNMCLELWAKHQNASSQTGPWFTLGNFANDGMSIGGPESGNFVAYTGGIPNYPGPALPNIWHHTAFLRRSGSWEFYHDGDPMNIGFASNTPTAASIASFFGAYYISHKINLSNIAFYETAPSAARIRAHYEAAIDYISRMNWSGVSPVRLPAGRAW